MRFVFDIGLDFASMSEAADIEHRIMIVDDPDIDNEFDALWTIIDWQMAVGRSPERFRIGSWPSRWERPKNITSFRLLDT